MKYRYYVGIDPGKHTGLAVWDSDQKKFLMVATFMIHQAIHQVLQMKKLGSFLVKIEDARQRKWYGDQAGDHALQGAGSIKRDCIIWEDFLTDEKIPFIMQEPKKGMTKPSADYFKKVTKWTGRTSNHARDAAWLVLGS